MVMEYHNAVFSAHLPQMPKSEELVELTHTTARVMANRGYRIIGLTSVEERDDKAVILHWVAQPIGWMN